MRTGLSADGSRSVVVADGTGGGLVDRALCAGTQDIAGSRPSAVSHNSR
ncbi:hypothetical protein KGD83_15625 [Nocardiopsis akebiae]|uniref:Uncharacterized protein n=1 Tax=Nocardiopsis akebiae TaxID=2831968 RepID=A0ABX8C126_9ACTN|nr:hypothetical protein [Nocardiopsis akebiae]QUX26811.1 hypothetical protein KGD83_15625 [Nocardiopsis akebiae]